MWRGEGQQASRFSFERGRGSRHAGSLLGGGRSRDRIAGIGLSVQIYIRSSTRRIGLARLSYMDQTDGTLLDGLTKLAGLERLNSIWWVGLE